MRVSETTGRVRTVGLVKPVRSKHPDLTKPGCTQAWIQVEVDLDGQKADLVLAVPVEAVRAGLLSRTVRVTIETVPEGAS